MKRTLIVLTLAVTAPALAQPCEPEWSDQFRGGGTDGPVYAQAIYDEDGAGPQPAAFFIGGEFSQFGGAPMKRLVRWSGDSASAAGGEPDGTVLTMAAFDEDGAGPKKQALFVGGRFKMIGGDALVAIGRWNGKGWSPLPPLPPLPPGGSGPWVNLIKAVDPDGPGPKPITLYVVSEKNFASNGSAFNLQSWNGVSWTLMNDGNPGQNQFTDVAPFDPDGAGPAPTKLYGVMTPGLYRLDGAKWVLASARNKPEHRFSRLAVFDADGPGPQKAYLYVAGSFDSVGKILVKNVARWDGTSWSFAGDGLEGVVNALRAMDIDGPGPKPAALIAGGTFSEADGKPASSIASFDGASWKPLPVGVRTLYYFGFVPGTVNVLNAYDHDGPGPGQTSLYAGGLFDYGGNTYTPNTAAWNGEEWDTTGPGVGGDVLAITLYNDGLGGGPGAVIGGRFGSIDGLPRRLIAGWNGAAWQPMGDGLSGGTAKVRAVEALAVHNDGSGQALYAAGEFTKAGAVTAKRIARWNGKAWSAVGGGFDKPVKALAVHDDGNGPKLYAGGVFTAADGAPASRIAVWDGTSWKPVGQGLNNAVYALRSFDDGLGGGPALYAGGAFTQADGKPAVSVARWNGSGWEAVGNITVSAVFCFGVYDAGEGPQLIAGGEFVFGAKFEEKFLGRWDGAAWRTIESTTPWMRPVGRVLALRVFDDGHGPALYAGGLFNLAGYGGSRFLVRLRDGEWSSDYPDRPVLALGIPYDDGDGVKSMFVGGAFNWIAGVPTGRIAKLIGCP